MFGLHEQFTVVVARGGDDVWAEIRRRRVPDDDRVPEELFEPAPPAAAVAGAAMPASRFAEEDIVESPAAARQDPIDDGLAPPAETHSWSGGAGRDADLEVDDQDEMELTLPGDEPTILQLDEEPAPPVALPIEQTPPAASAPPAAAVAPPAVAPVKPAAPLEPSSPVRPDVPARPVTPARPTVSAAIRFRVASQ